MRVPYGCTMLWRCFVIGAIWLAGVATAQAQNAQLPTLHTHESYIGELMRPSTLAIDDPMAVFGFVLDCLPSRVNVYPTENYYYFTFIAGGVHMPAMSVSSRSIPGTRSSTSSISRRKRSGMTIRSERTSFSTRRVG
jgi:hypothetical protein